MSVQVPFPHAPPCFHPSRGFLPDFLQIRDISQSRFYTTTIRPDCFQRPRSIMNALSIQKDNLSHPARKARFHNKVVAPNNRDECLSVPVSLVCNPLHCLHGTALATLPPIPSPSIPQKKEKGNTQTEPFSVLMHPYPPTT